MAHENIWEEKGLYRVFSNVISGKEVLDSNLELHGDPRFDTINYVLNDFSTIEDFQVSEMDITLIANIDAVAARSKPALKIAIVATYEPLLEWIHKYSEKMVNSIFETHLFDNLEDARQWCSSPK